MSFSSPFQVRRVTLSLSFDKNRTCIISLPAGSRPRRRAEKSIMGIMQKHNINPNKKNTEGTEEKVGGELSEKGPASSTLPGRRVWHKARRCTRRKSTAALSAAVDITNGNGAHTTFRRNQVSGNRPRRTPAALREGARGRDSSQRSGRLPQYPSGKRLTQGTVLHPAGSPRRLCRPPGPAPPATERTQLSGGTKSAGNRPRRTLAALRGREREGGASQRSGYLPQRPSGKGLAQGSAL